ncbi:MAG: hypothetical protein ABMA25_16065, partial [Ilumatobacteraceae bacterium]
MRQRARGISVVISLVIGMMGVAAASTSPVLADSAGSSTVRRDGAGDRLAVGNAFSCVIVDSGDVSCWGYGAGTGLGYGTLTNIGDNETPAANPVNGGMVPLPGGRAAVALAAGYGHVCAVLDNGTVTCWVQNTDGQLGYGNTNVIGDDETPATNPVNSGIVALPGGHAATAITAAGHHTCALLDDGTITCWGSNVAGELGYGNTNKIGDNETPAANPVSGGIVALPGGHAATAISAGFFQTCALLDNGTLTCWGLNTAGQLGYGNTNTIGDNETPAANPVNGGIISLPGGHTAIAIASGSESSCALLDDNTVTCWGEGVVGTLGYGNGNDIGDNETPATNPVNGGIVALPDALTAVAIVAGGQHTCAVLSNSRLSCWGANASGQLGYGNTTRIGDDETPAANPVNNGWVPTPTSRMVTAVAANDLHSCALLENGTITCWGYNQIGQLGYGNTNTIGDNETPATNPVNGGTVVLPGARASSALSAGGNHTCALLDNGTVSCWGIALNGQLGYANTNNIGDNETPAGNSSINGGIVGFAAARSATALATGESHTCALLDNGRVTCWGLNANGQLGYGNTTTVGVIDFPSTNSDFVALPNGRAATAIAAGAYHTCALLDNGTVTCWGVNTNGQLGYGNTNVIGDNETPDANPVNGGLVALPAGRTVAAVTGGGNHTCALLDNGTIMCWGLDNFGQLGYGNTNDIGDNETPTANPVSGGIVALPAGRTATAVTAGANHTCAALDNSTVTCWGSNVTGQLGYGNTNAIGDNETPAANPVDGGIVALPGGRTALSLTAGNFHTCAVLDNGAATCWGSSLVGQLGYGNVNNIGDNEKPAANPVSGGVVSVPNQLTMIDYRSLQPARLLDTRAGGVTVDGLFQKGGQRAAGSTFTLPVSGRGGFPVNATSITLSIAAVSPTSGGYLTVWPCSQPQPNASSLNYAAGVNTANTVITGAAGGVCIFTSKATHLIADVVGYTPRTSTLIPLRPARLADTRASGITIDGFNQATGQQAAGSTLELPVWYRGNVPGGTETAIMNVTAVNPTATGYLTIHPCGSPTPNASNLNFTAGTTTANLAITRVGVGFSVCIFTSQATDLIVDVVGYYTDAERPTPSMLRTFNPGRVVDTRGSGATTDGRYRNTGPLVANATTT